MGEILQRRVVLDKSFLQGVSLCEFEELAKKYVFVATTPLFGECLSHFTNYSKSSEDEKRQNLNGIRKFSDKQHFMMQMDESGTLLSLEASNRRPCFPITNQERGMIWFNASLVSKECLDEVQSNAIKRWQRQVDESSLGFHIDALTKSRSPIFDWNEKLEALIKPSERDDKILRKELLSKIAYYQKKISTDLDFVREQYDRLMRPFQYPPAHLLDSRWFLYRLCQTMMLVHLEFLNKAVEDSIQIDEKRRKKLRHDCIDAEYCMFAAQYAAFATSDKRASERFRLLCPDGLLLFYDHQAKAIRTSGF